MSTYSMTAFLQKALLDGVLAKAAYPAAAELYLSLHTADPTDAGSFAAEISTSGTGYARQPLLASMSATSLLTGISANTLAVTAGPASIDWGTITHIGISDALTAGTMWFRGELSAAKIMDAGQSFQLAASQLQIQFD